MPRQTKVDRLITKWPNSNSNIRKLIERFAILNEGKLPTEILFYESDSKSFTKSIIPFILDVKEG